MKTTSCPTTRNDGERTMDSNFSSRTRRIALALAAGTALLLSFGAAAVWAAEQVCGSGTPHDKHISQFQCGVCHPNGNNFGFTNPYTFPKGTTTAGGTIVRGSPGTPATCTVACHTPGRTPSQPVAWEAQQAPYSCTACHDAALLPPAHVPVSPTSSRADCTICHGAEGHLGGTVTLVGHAASWLDPNSTDFHAYDANAGLAPCRDCHGQDLGGRYNAVGCSSCHDQNLPAGVASWKTNCVMCHGGVENATGAPPNATWGNDGDPVRVGAHAQHVGESAIAPPFDCGVCHTKPLDALSAGHIDGPTATVAFSGVASAQGSLQPAWDRGTATCSNTYCHGGSLGGGANTAPVWTEVGQSQAACGTCHGLPPPAPHPDAPDLISCNICHPNTVDAAGSIIAPSTGGRHLNGSILEDTTGGSHPPAAPPSAPVVLFPDDAHDPAGRIGDKPYFAVIADCATCHVAELSAIHGSHCATCHPSPRDTVGTWGRGCQQGGCHATYHEDSARAHLPFESAVDPGNDCEQCHDSATWGVTQSLCLNCHAAIGPGDVTPPETFSDALATYVGPALIHFSIEENGKVGVGRTFYQLDGGPETAAGKSLLLLTPGTHTLEFWSVDQAGNTESAMNTVTFTTTEDLSPPTTTSDARATYNESAVITVTATDNSTVGVKNTYFKLNGGPIQTGTSVVAAPVTVGTWDYTLEFWSVDWAGNVEAVKTVPFTVTVAPPPQAIAPASISVPATSTTGSITATWTASTTSGATYVLERSYEGGPFGEIYQGTLLSYTTSGLANGSYVYRVKTTKSGYTDSDYATSGTCAVTLTAGAPGAVTVPATDSDGAFTVSWGASATSGVTYVLERSDNGGAFAQVYSGTTSSYAASGLASGSYVFRVKATKSGYADSGYSTSGACSVTLLVAGAPGSITAPSADTDGAFSVSWTASSTSGVTYVLEQSLNGGSFVQVYSGTALTYAVTVSESGSYVYRVKATRNGYTPSAYATSGTCAVNVVVVAPPTSISVPATSTSTSLAVSWGASPDSGVTYKLERSLNGGTFGVVYSGTGLTATVTGMGNGTYVFRVKATRADNVDSAYVTSGTCVGLLTASTPGSIAVPATDTDGAFAVNWTASATSGVTYVLEQSNGGAFVQVYSGTATTYAATGLATGNYVFKVKATKSGYVDSDYAISGTCAVTVTVVDAPVSITVPATDTDGAFTVSWPASVLSGVIYKLERADNGGEFAQVYSGGAATYAVTGLPTGDYQFRVKATKAGYLESPYTTSETCRVTITAADPPTSISVPGTDTDGAFSVTWGASPMPGVTYKLEQSNGGAFTQIYSGTNLSYAVSGLANGSYTYRVKATLSGYGDSAYVTSGICGVTITKTDPPASISVPATSTSTSVAVSWGASPNGVTYVLERALVGGAWVQVYSGPALTTTVNGMGNGTYQFRVKATLNGYADSDYVTSTDCAVNLAATPPGSITVPATDTDGVFTVNWTASSTSGVSYVLERSDNGGDFAPVYSGTALSYAVTGLGTGNYVFRVKATRSGYTDSDYVTAPACEVTLTAVDAPATISVPALDQDGKFTVSWPASLLGGVTYKLERADNGGAFVQVYSGASLSYAVTLTDGSYQFQVKAVKTGYLESPYTTSGTCTVTVTTVEPPASISVPATSTATTLFVSWGDSPTPGVTYVLERKLNTGAFGAVYTGTATSATVTGMGNGDYQFRVKAIKTDNVDSAYVTSGLCVGTLTALAPATITVPATDADGKFTVNWAPSGTSGVTYKLEQSADDGATYTQIYAGTALSYAITTALPNGSYLFRIKATKTNYVDSGYTTSGTCVVTGP